MALPDLLPIPPFPHPAQGEVALPGSKSLTNRALLLAALCDAPVTLTGALFSEDTHLMTEALRRLGFTVDTDETTGTARVGGQAGAFAGDGADLFVGLAGTAARFLTALCAAAPRGTYRKPSPACAEVQIPAPAPARARSVDHPRPQWG